MESPFAISFDPANPYIHREICQLICSWLSDNNYSATLQIFRDEVNARGKEEHSVRKAARGISKALEEGSWDLVYTGCKKLDSLNVQDSQLVTLMLAKQNYMELVDEGDAQRAFTFFLRRIKPFEDIIGRASFQEMSYLLTCRCVADAAVLYPHLRGWTPAASRLALTQWMHQRIDVKVTQDYTHEHRMDYCVTTSLDLIIKQALTFQYSSLGKPPLLFSNSPTSLGCESTPPVLRVSSVLAPLHLQMPPLIRLFSANVNHIVKTCQPFLDIPAMAVGTNKGLLLWCSLREGGAVETTPLPTHHGGRVWSMDGNKKLLVSCGGRSLLVFRVSSAKRELAYEFSCPSEPLSVRMWQCGTYAAVGTAEGDIVLYDLKNGLRAENHRFCNSGCVALANSVTGNTMYAGFKDGTVRVIDLATSIVTRILSPPVAAEVTSISLSPTNIMLAVSYKNSTIRLWDLVTGVLDARRLGGYANSSKSFVRGTFGCLDTQIISGSEDGNLSYWSLSAPSADECGSLSSSAGNQIDTASSVCRPSPTTMSERSWEQGRPACSSPISGCNALLTPLTKLSMSTSMITDVKIEGRLLAICLEDGMICVCAPEGYQFPLCEGLMPQ